LCFLKCRMRFFIERRVMDIEFEFENAWHKATLLNKSTADVTYYHVFVKDKQLAKRFAVSFLFVEEKGKFIYNIGGKLFPQHRLFRFSLINAILY